MVVFFQQDHAGMKIVLKFYFCDVFGNYFRLKHQTEMVGLILNNCRRMATKNYLLIQHNPVRK